MATGFVQRAGSNSAVGSGSLTSLVIPVGSAVAAGLTVLVTLTGQGASVTFAQSVIDTQDNTYAPEYQYYSGADRPVEVWRADGVKALSTSDSLTITFGAAQIDGISAIADAVTGIAAHDSAAGETFASGPTNNTATLVIPATDIFVYSAGVQNGDEASTAVTAPLLATGAAVLPITSPSASMLTAYNNSPVAGTVSAKYTNPSGHSAEIIILGFPAPSTGGHRASSSVIPALIATGGPA